MATKHSTYIDIPGNKNNINGNTNNGGRPISSVVILDGLISEMGSSNNDNIAQSHSNTNTTYSTSAMSQPVKQMRTATTTTATPTITTTPQHPHTLRSKSPRSPHQPPIVTLKPSTNSSLSISATPPSYSPPPPPSSASFTNSITSSSFTHSPRGRAVLVSSSDRCPSPTSMSLKGMTLPAPPLPPPPPPLPFDDTIPPLFPPPPPSLEHDIPPPPPPLPPLPDITTIYSSSPTSLNKPVSLQAKRLTPVLPTLPLPLSAPPLLTPPPPAHNNNHNNNNSLMLLSPSLPASLADIDFSSRKFSLPVPPPPPPPISMTTSTSMPTISTSSLLPFPPPPPPPPPSYEESEYTNPDDFLTSPLSSPPTSQRTESQWASGQLLIDNNGNSSSRRSTDEGNHSTFFQRGIKSWEAPSHKSFRDHLAIANSRDGWETSKSSPTVLMMPNSVPTASPEPAKEEECDADGLTYKQRMRKKLIDEIILTEKDYVHDLDLIVRVFLAPLKQMKLLTTDETSTIFSNIETILGVNRLMYEELNKQITTEDPHRFNVKVGAAFLNLSPYLKMYSSYCSNQQKAFKLLEDIKKHNQPLCQFLEDKMQDASCRGLPFTGFLIKPVQRICKYPLFIKDLIKYTHDTHEDHKPLLEADAKVNEVVLSVNEFKRAMESLQHVLELAEKIVGVDDLVIPGRKFSCEFEASVSEPRTSDESLKPRHIILFNDLVLICKERKKHKKQNYSVKAKVVVSKAKLVQLTINNVKGLEFQHDGKQYHLFFQSDAEYTKYTKLIRDAFLQIKKNAMAQTSFFGSLRRNGPK